MDQVVGSRNKAAISELKAIFGLESLTDIRDFAMTIAFPSKLVTGRLHVRELSNASVDQSWRADGK